MFFFGKMHHRTIHTFFKKMSIELSQAQISDIEAIDRCNRALLPENYPREFYNSFFASDYCFNFVVRDKSNKGQSNEESNEPSNEQDNEQDKDKQGDRQTNQQTNEQGDRQSDEQSGEQQSERKDQDTTESVPAPINKSDNDSHDEQLVANENRDIAGYILCLLQNDQKMAVVGHIYSIGVYEQFRRRGFATALMMCAEAVMKKRCPELKYLSLHVRKKNKEAYKFYTKLGFSRAKVVKKYYRNPAEDAYLMKKPVAATTTAPQAE